ncbi:MAG TPA: hypothetical protein VJ032_08180, partial [Thermoanaerobaculia bacterium]|nr:hypothetical protein [Thermoanaerobaculia bacterium]
MGFGVTTVAVISMVGFYTMVTIVGAMFARARQRRSEVQAEVQTKLIERFGTAPELIDFLQSDAGHQFVDGFQNAPRFTAREKILSGLRRGIITTLLGLGLLAIWAVDVRENRDCIYPAFIILSLGIGFFLST